MIRGIGVDSVDCSRLRRAVDRHGQRFIERVFLEPEWTYCQTMADPIPHLAARFAAKEATRKALAHLPPLGWHDVEVVREPTGPVGVKLHGKARDGAETMGVVHIHLSVSHERGHAVAMVVMES